MKIRGLICIMLCAAMLIGVFPYASAASDVSREEAIEWVKSRLGTKIDVDGVYGAQCADLIMAYYEFLGENRSRGNGCDYATEKYPLPKGWQRIYHGEPEAGDILVYTGTASNPYGHVAIYESDYSHYHQNVTKAGGVVQCDWYYSDSFKVMEYWGIIKPVFAGDDEYDGGDEDETTAVTEPFDGEDEDEDEDEDESEDESALRIRLDPNGGETDVDYLNISFGEQFGELPVPRREGYIFLNWIYPTLFGVETVKETDIADEYILFIGQTFYAMWSKPCTLSFETNGGESIEPITFSESVSLVDIVPVKDGAIFGGWYSDAALTAAIEACPPDSDVTVYAKWISVDFKASDWAKDELIEAAKASLIPDSLAEADMRGDITRAQFAAVAVRLYEAVSGRSIPAPFANPFSDTNSIEVLKAYDAGIVLGVSENTFAPDALITREQAAVMLTRVYRAVKGDSLQFEMPAPFTDDAEISDYARESVYFMAANNIIKGVGNNMFAPKNTTEEQIAVGFANATIEQSLLIVARLNQKLKA